MRRAPTLIYNNHPRLRWNGFIYFVEER
jgi:hypothetical protein